MNDPVLHFDDGKVMRQICRRAHEGKERNLDRRIATILGTAFTQTSTSCESPGAARGRRLAGPSLP